jgi:hypothetical protein
VGVRGLILVSVVAVTGWGCGSTTIFRCVQNSDCNLEPGGRCFTGNCAYAVPMAECPSGYLYGNDTGSLSGTCVPLSGEAAAIDMSTMRVDASFADRSGADSTSDQSPLADQSPPDSTPPDLVPPADTLRSDTLRPPDSCIPTNPNPCSGFCAGTQTDSCGGVHTCTQSDCGSSGTSCNASTHVCCTPEPNICSDNIWTCGSAVDACGISHPCGICTGTNKCILHTCECATCDLPGATPSGISRDTWGR